MTGMSHLQVIKLYDMLLLLVNEPYNFILQFFLGIQNRICRFFAGLFFKILLVGYVNNKPVFTHGIVLQRDRGKLLMVSCDNFALF